MVSIARTYRDWLHVAASGLAALLLSVSCASARSEVDETPKAQQPTTNYAEQVESLASARRAQNASATEPEAKQDQSASKNNSEGIELAHGPTG